MIMMMMSRWLGWWVMVDEYSWAYNIHHVQLTLAFDATWGLPQAPILSVAKTIFSIKVIL